eukprot:6706203-Pyramimonas_sp.AAC.1
MSSCPLSLSCATTTLSQTPCAGSLGMRSVLRTSLGTLGSALRGRRKLRGCPESGSHASSSTPALLCSIAV